MNNKNAWIEIMEIMNDNKQGIDHSIPALEIKNYTKKFGSFLSIKNASFIANHGSIHGFIGPNGSGKTTTIKALIGAYIPTSGSLLINGHQAGTIKANKLIGYVPENASFPKHLNALEYLISMGKLSGLSKKVVKIKSLQILKFLGLEKQMKRKPNFFSSGMQKKILLAQSLLSNPSILILDEPASNLDPSSRSELFEQLISLRNSGKTILISSHILSELEKIIDEVTLVYYGEILFSGKVKDFLKKANSLFVKSSDNGKLIKWLKEQNYKTKGDIKNEIEVIDINKKEAQKIYQAISKINIDIISFRTNDLQLAYDNLSKKANKDSKGIQKMKSRNPFSKKSYEVN